MAIGSVFSPLVGMFADRVANSEKVLAVLNGFVALLLILAFFTADPTMIFVWLVLAMCAYMPTWGLTSSIAMANSTAEAFPLIRVFGSLGWVCAAVFALGAKALFNESIDGTSIPLACAAGVAAFSAVFALFLPATPPKAKGEPMSVTDALGLRAFGMLKDRNIAIFMACVVVWTVAFTIYWMYGSFLAYDSLSFRYFFVFTKNFKNRITSCHNTQKITLTLSFCGSDSLSYGSSLAYDSLSFRYFSCLFSGFTFRIFCVLSSYKLN